MSAARTKAPRVLVDRNLRVVELLLILLAAAVSALALLLVQLGAIGSVQTGAFIAGGVYWAAVLALHILLVAQARKADPIIVPVAALINALGVTMIYRIDIEKDAVGLSSTSARQVMWSVLAIVLAGATLWVVRNHRFLQRYTYLFMLASVMLLVMPMIPGLGTTNGTSAELWVKLGPFTFQPSEFAKIALAIFFAGYLVVRADTMSTAGRRFLGMRIPRAKDFGPIIVVWLLALAVLVFQRDLGTSLLYFGLFLMMLYVATGLVSWIWIGLVLIAVGGVGAYQVLPYVQGRIHAWLDPFDPALYDAEQGSYQLAQGLFGQAHGGIFGTGWGKGYPSTTPLARSDFIFSSLAEEIGLVGVFALLCLFLVLVSRGLRVGFSVQDDFGKLLGAGLAFVLSLQVFIVIGGVTKVIPLTGLPSPFLAAGGSSLLANWIIMALLLRISDSVRSSVSAIRSQLVEEAA